MHNKNRAAVDTYNQFIQKEFAELDFKAVLDRIKGALAGLAADYSTEANAAADNQNDLAGALNDKLADTINSLNSIYNSLKDCDHVAKNSRQYSQRAGTIAVYKSAEHEHHERRTFQSQKDLDAIRSSEERNENEYIADAKQNGTYVLRQTELEAEAKTQDSLYQNFGWISALNYPTFSLFYNAGKFALGLFPMAKRIAGGSFAEALEEFGQEVINLRSLDKPPDPVSLRESFRKFGKEYSELRQF
ncbi:MAG: hypothetical protein SR3Q1_10365 [Quinella sp. 3Q1]|nr:hypothetical protein [Quinella sp. 3Q1]MBR6887497.1 hypothetical protein [Selenomonadaceae bacterium]